VESANDVSHVEDVQGDTAARVPSQAIPLFGTYWGDHEDQLEMSVEVNVKTASALV
jgi:hypothetical protein